MSSPQGFSSLQCEQPHTRVLGARMHEDGEVRRLQYRVVRERVHDRYQAVQERVFG